ncbi:acyl-CoA N-acyltransferase [Dacryopinax primogenitus]|uniref:Acyl-CoA N-acyltransferase n=1 Tax=Dacryopinax primogenitus (strain DJM 731) TaxID=1858805 RepID=M5G630_DACPD|nr:acyl-CoA N-acyltransferase [Dacryopinax primogenitus]EJU01277.1 acyl-CoA N-acyltransferase [Dacryopinax primogenitus]
MELPFGSHCLSHFPSYVPGMPAPSPPPFKTTTRLQIRAFQDNDAAFWLHLRGQKSVLQPATFGYAVPPALNMWETWRKLIDEALFAGIIEVKGDFSGLVKRLEEDEGVAWDPAPEQQDERGKEKYMEWASRSHPAGIILLRVHIPKNRDAELGMMFSPEWQGLGLGIELLRWLIPHAFDQLGMHRLSLTVKVSNERARRLYEKVGFVLEGRRKAAVWEDGRWEDILEMGIVAEEFWERCHVEKERAREE